MTKEENVSLLDDSAFAAPEYVVRSNHQKKRIDYEAQLLKKRFEGIISPEECAEKLGVPLLDWYRKEIIYLGSDPRFIKEFEEYFGEKFDKEGIADNARWE